MNVRKPSYYDDFHCVAGRCPDSCCRQWEVDVDQDAAALYRSLPGSLGDRLRQVLRATEDGTVMTIENGRCPMWQADGLCRIQAELGEQALCRVCSRFPRLRHDYGSFAELGLELSCPEAARLILNPSDAPPLSFEEDGEAEEPEDAFALEILLQTRQTALSLLRQAQTPSDALTLLLFYGAQPPPAPCASRCCPAPRPRRRCTAGPRGLLTLPLPWKLPTIWQRNRTSRAFLNFSGGWKS